MGINIPLYIYKDGMKNPSDYEKMHLRLCHSSLYMYMMQYSSTPAVLHIVDLQSFIGYIFATQVDCLLISFYYQR